MKVKIVADGTPNGSRVVDAETGEEIAGVTFARWEHPAGGLPFAVIHVHEVRAEITVDAEVIAGSQQAEATNAEHR